MTTPLPFSARRDSLPLWRQYAAEHTGLAIGFDAMQGILAGGFNHEDRLARPVVDAPMRPPSSIEAEVRLPLTKSDEWEHEDEWRIVDVNLRSCVRPDRSPADALALRDPAGERAGSDHRLPRHDRRP